MADHASAVPGGDVAAVDDHPIVRLVVNGDVTFSGAGQLTAWVELNPGGERRTGARAWMLSALSGEA